MNYFLAFYLAKNYKKQVFKFIRLVCLPFCSRHFVTVCDPPTSLNCFAHSLGLRVNAYKSIEQILKKSQNQKYSKYQALKYKPKNQTKF